MGTYEYLPHTADEKFHIVGRNMDDAFATSVEAFYGIMLGDIRVEKKITKEIKIKAKKLMSLLYDFLNELVFLFDDEGLILQQVLELHIQKNEEDYSLEAKLVGDKQYDYELITEIKNMTYSDMEIIQHSANGEQGSGKVELTVVVDI